MVDSYVSLRFCLGTKRGSPRADGHLSVPSPSLAARDLSDEWPLGSHVWVAEDLAIPYRLLKGLGDNGLIVGFCLLESKMLLSEPRGDLNAFAIRVDGKSRWSGQRGRLAYRD